MKLLIELFKLTTTLLVFALVMPMLTLARWLLVGVARIFYRGK